MSSRKLFVVYGVTAAVIGLPFTILHLTARPDDAVISPLQRLAAAMANGFGPWGGALVRLVDFPNAGLRTFSWLAAIGLTLAGGLLLALPPRARGRLAQASLAAAWTVFLVIWFGTGFAQIADGLL